MKYCRILTYIIIIFLICHACLEFPRLAEVSTGIVEQLTENSAHIKGVIEDEGEGISSYGHCWSENNAPTLDQKTTYSSDIYNGKVFTSTINNLEPGTRYYVRSYAITQGETVYGSTETFQTTTESSNNLDPEITLPEIEIGAIKNITATLAEIEATVTDNGNDENVLRGVCWNTTPEPTVDDHKVISGTGIGKFTSYLNDLEPNTTYYTRAYATNNEGTAYSDGVSFTTTDGEPGVSVPEISKLTYHSIRLEASVTQDGGYSVTSRGICWDTASAPTLSDNRTQNGNGTGDFTSMIDELSTNTTYYFRSYAINAVDTVYSDEISSTLWMDQAGETLTDYDGNEYNTVKIGNQVWMAQNLKTTHYADGTPLVDGTAIGNTSGDYETKYWFVYDDNQANKDTYGLLYTWAAVMNGAASSNTYPSEVQGVCPTGWHIPSGKEWKELEIFLGMNEEEANADGYRGTNEGGKLKETGTAHWNEPNTGATNESGFSALPGGYRDFDGSFFNIGHRVRWWSATEYSSSDAWSRSIDANLSWIFRYNFNKQAGLSMRCVRD